MTANDAPVALVTGASRGIGLAIAVALSRAGYRIARTARDAKRLANTRDQLADPGASAVVATDLRDPGAADRILREVTATLGPPQVLVNNAGTAPSDRIENTSDATLEEVLDLHLKAPFRLIRAALPAMRGMSEACIVQVASTAGLRGFPFTAAYTAGKHGMVGLTRALAAELQQTSVRAYAVCAGFVDTDITRRAAAAIAERGNQSEAEALAKMAAMNEIGRMLQPKEVGTAVVKLVRERPQGCIYNLDRDPPAFEEGGKNHG